MTAPPPNDLLDQLQTITIWIGFVGLLVRIFGTKIKDVKFVQVATGKKGKRNPKKRTKKVHAKSKPTATKKATPQPKPKAWAQMHKVDAAEIARVEAMFMKGRGGFDDSWG